MSRKNLSGNPNEKMYDFMNKRSEKRSIDIETPSENNYSSPYDNGVFPTAEQRAQDNANPNAAGTEDVFFTAPRNICHTDTTEAESVREESDTKSNTTSDEAEDIIKKARAEAERIKQEAELNAAKITEAARSEASAITISAKTEAANTRAEATKEAEGIKASALNEMNKARAELNKKAFELNLRESESDRIREELKKAKADQVNDYNNAITRAKEMGERIILQAEARKAELVAEAEFQKKQIIDSVKDEAIKEAKENGLKEYFAKENKTQEEKRKELNDIYDKVSEDSAALKKQLSGEAFDLSNKMTSALNVSISSINECLQQVLAVQNNVSTVLDKWQRGLYTTQLTPLCTSYETIGRLISTHEGNLAKYQAGSDDPINAARVDVLAPIIKTLKTFREQLGKALAPFGISVYYPEVGEGFDPNYHSVEDVYAIPDMLIDHPITECIRPGFIKSGFDRDPQAVLVRAVVKVKTDSPTI